MTKNDEEIQEGIIDWDDEGYWWNQDEEYTRFCPLCGDGWMDTGLNAGTISKCSECGLWMKEVFDEPIEFQLRDLKMNQEEFERFKKLRSFE